MDLETLPDELLFGILEFLSTAHLFRAFYGLNRRFDTLLLEHFRIHGLDFRSISQHDFDTICRHHLPLIVGQVTSLHLSEAYDTPEQAHYFLEHGFALRQFTGLRSLSLQHFISIKKINKILSECCHLTNLTHLKLDDCHCWFDHTGEDTVIDIIWSLPKLIYCSLNIKIADQVHFTLPTVISFSIKYLIISCVQCLAWSIPYLFEYTPYLRYYKGYFNALNYGFISSPISSAITLDLCFLSVKPNMIENILEHMPNLRQLTVHMKDEACIDGHQWEHIIRNYLPKLKRFKFNMEIKSISNKEQEVDRLLDSFRNRFWLEEHCWFVRCHWNLDGNEIKLCTLPYAFDYFCSDFPLISKSTHPRGENYSSYD
ncbi:unnamed protein product [Rotaria socialis]|uniref:F-box domain-containing protein n=1 Tax=Rotaria socialis TaxID=392032 RepID=A0A817SDP0_9BILA|nr:unnamed protein product [Rotaria socialis]CAF4661393.1 unnamed protein product [Rotaria socialis]